MTDEAAVAAAAAFEREPVAASQPRSPPSVGSAEGAAGLLAGGADAEGGQPAATPLALPAVLEPSLPSMTAEAHLPPGLPQPPLTPAVPITPLPPAPAERTLTPAAAPASPSTAPAEPEAHGCLPLPASPGELLRSQTGPLEGEGDEEAPSVLPRPAGALPSPSPPQRPSSAERGSFATGPSPLDLDAAVAAGLAGQAEAGWVPEGLAEPLEAPLPDALPLPLSSGGGGPPMAAPSLPQGPVVAGTSTAGKASSPAHPGACSTAAVSTGTEPR